MSCLHACPSCARHVRSNETSCPFCEAELPGHCTVAVAPPIAKGASRTAITFVAAAALMACGKGNEPVAVYGPAPVNDLPDASSVTVTPPDPSADPAKDGGK